ncbi:unnamed protein product [Sympodiomycopsis kandeliae]
MSAKPQKADQYSKEIDRARLKGEWTSQQLGPSKNLPWTELLRKYAKHNPNETVISAVVTVEQQLRSALIHFYKDEEYTDLSHDQDDAAPHSGSTLFPPNVPHNRQGNGWSGHQFEGIDAQLEEHLTSAGSHDGLRQGITAIHAYALFAQGKDEDAVAFLHESKFLETVNTDQMRPEEQAYEYQTALFLLGFVTYGLCNERLHYARPTAGYLPFAFAGYARAIELHEQTRGGRRAAALPGLPEDEIERWAETALYRNALLSVREGDFSLGINAVRAYQAQITRWPSDFRLCQRNVINRVYLHVLNRAVEQGVYTPPPALPPKSADDWRSQAYQRSVVAAVAARVKIRDFESERASNSATPRRTVGVDAKNISSRTTSTRRPNPHRALRPASSFWSNEVLTASRSAALTVERSSEFPRAGQINRSALLLSDELVYSWQLNGEQGGEHADDLIESLYTLTRLTFHSQRISRHLFNALIAAQNFAEAREALELYVSIVDKAREGDAAGSAALVEESKLRQKEQEEQGYDLEEIKKKEKEEEEKPLEERENQKDKFRGLSQKAKDTSKQVLLDADDDATFVRTLLKGARMLVKYLNDPKAGDAMATKALNLMSIKGKQDKIGADKEHLARALRVAGQCRAALIAAHPDPARLNKVQYEARSLLEQSLELDPQSSEAWYQLAYIQAEVRDISAAIPSIRRAIELEPADVQSWHLLTILVSAQKDYKAAFRIAEVALDEAEEDDEADAKAILRSSIGVSQPQGDTSKPSAESATATSRTELLSVDYPPTRAERDEAILQLMMTQNALEEVIAGADIAIESQKETFQFFHKKLSQYVQPNSTSGSALGGIGRSGSNTAFAQPQNGANGLANGATDVSQSVSGLGQSGSTAQHRSGSVGNFGSPLQPLTSGNSPVAAVMPSATSSSASTAVNGVGSKGKSANGVSSDLSSVDGQGKSGQDAPRNPSATLPEGRKLYQVKKEQYQLCSLWLMSAATFRRSGRTDEARVAIQEAELVDPGRSEVWTQLALLTERSDVKLAVNSLYKALACDADNVAASVHLARIFLEHEDAVAPSTTSTHSDHASKALPADPNSTALHDSSLNRSISGTSKPNTKSLHGTQGQFSSLSEAQTSSVAKNLSSISLAEGLLISITNNLAWNSSEAWLYLAKVNSKTDRREKARTFLKYALELEEYKFIRALEIAIPRR